MPRVGAVAPGPQFANEDVAPYTAANRLTARNRHPGYVENWQLCL